VPRVEAARAVVDGEHAQVDGARSRRATAGSEGVEERRAHAAPALRWLHRDRVQQHPGLRSGRCDQPGEPLRRHARDSRP